MSDMGSEIAKSLFKGALLIGFIFGVIVFGICCLIKYFS